MRFDERFLDELKSRLRPSEVIGKTVKLKRQGREWVGLSPFTKEKSPSFFVNDDKGFFHDFSSGKHGDVISFLQETQRLSFPEAVERLAAEAGMALPTPDPESAERAEKQQGLADWLELAAKWYEAQLRRSPGVAARETLEKRGLPEDQWDRFRLGYAPAGRTGVKDALIQRGARPADLIEAGLLISPEGGGSPYDRFRDRLIFPIMDVRGRVISFGGRAMNPDDRAKYLNGPESPLFHKGATLYGLQEARRLLGAGGGETPVVVVEGYMDVIACQRAGIAAVAPLGTALTEEQMERLWRITPEPVLCFDGDAAGLRAAYRVIERALPMLKSGRSFRFALLGGGQDPDDILRDKGAPALRQALTDTRAFAEVLFAKERDLEALDTPERKAGLKGRLRQAAAAIADRDLSEQYRRDLFERFDALFPHSAPRGPARAQGAWRRDWKGGPPAPTTPTDEGRAAALALSRSVEPVAAALAHAVIDDPDRLDDHLEAVSRHGFGDRALDPLAQEIIRLRLSGQALDSAALRRHLAQSGFDALTREVEKAAAKSGAPFLAAHAPLAETRARWSQAYEALTRMAALEDALASAKSGAHLGFDAGAFSRLKAERDALKRAIKTGTIWGDEGS